MKKLIIFDLDGTLSYSKHDLSSEMAEIVCKLLEKVHVGVISGASLAQFEAQFISYIPCKGLFANLHILPTNGASYFTYDQGRGEWISQYFYGIKEEDREGIRKSIEKAVKESGIEIPKELYGEQLEDRGAQISWSALGQEAPLEIKDGWDKDQQKRLKIKGILDGLLPDFQIGIGGLTTIDITEKGIDKGFAIKELMTRLSLSKDEILYVGDALFPGGNDYPAMKAEVDTLQVIDPMDTMEKMQEYIK